jgi:histo-blood group ABO system transferase
VVFSDANDIGNGKHPYQVIPHEGFPGATLHRYHTFLKVAPFLRTFDYLFYCDVDMLFVDKVGEEIFSDGITATLHPGFDGGIGTPERRPNSTAYIPPTAKNKYFCGGFNGGESEAFLQMAETTTHNIDLDARNGVTAIWHDESHLNRYLYDNPPAKILTPSYCYPEGWEAPYTPKLMALSKAICRVCGEKTAPHVNYCPRHNAKN